MPRALLSSRAGCLSVLTIVIALVGVPTADAATTINSTTTYSSNTTWTTAGSPYILNADVRVSSTATLTIDPGVVVKLNGLLREIRVDGTLNAAGTEANPIVFTSLKDDRSPVTVGVMAPRSVLPVIGCGSVSVLGP